MWKFITPRLPVADVRETQRYYRDVLGFKIAWIWRETIGAVYNGHTEVYFEQVDEFEPGMVCYVRVDGVDDVYEKYREGGAKIVEPIASKPYGMREFTIEDNNGHFFRIGENDGPVQDLA